MSYVLDKDRYMAGHQWSSWPPVRKESEASGAVSCFGLLTTADTAVQHFRVRSSLDDDAQRRRNKGMGPLGRKTEKKHVQ